MALVDEVQSRYSAQRLIELTNPDRQGDGSTAVALNTARLALAATDVEADFLSYAGESYDGALPQHVTVAVEGVMVKLQLRGASASDKADERHNQWIQRLRDMAKSRARKRVTPTTPTQAQRTVPGEDGQTVYPAFDDRRFEGVVPDAPRNPALDEDVNE